MFYRLARLFFGFCLRLFYRLEIAGTPPPEGRPVLFCGNHPNGLLDPALVLATSPRTIRFMAKAPLLRMPVLGWILRGMRAVPVFRAQDGADTGRNARTFDAVVDALVAGGAVCIFPEGTSHSVPRLLKLKTGAARIALLAQEKLDPGRGLLVVPVGVTYAAKHRFRSRALAVYGAPIDAAPFLGIEGGEEPRMRALTEAIRDGLAAVCVELDRADELPLLARLDALYAAERGLEAAGGALGPAFPRWKTILAGLEYHRTRSPERVAKLRERLEAYVARVDRLGLVEEGLDRRVGLGAALRFAAVRLLPLLLLAPFALAGAIAFYVPWKVPGWIADALQVGLDMVATVKLLSGLVVGLLTYGGWCWLALWLGGPWAALAAAAVLPGLAVLALGWSHAAEEAAEDVRVFVRLFGREGLRARLVERRRAIVDEVDRLAAEVSAAELQEAEA